MESLADTGIPGPLKEMKNNKKIGGDRCGDRQRGIAREVPVPAVPITIPLDSAGGLLVIS